VNTRPFATTAKLRTVVSNAEVKLLLLYGQSQPMYGDAGADAHFDAQADAYADGGSDAHYEGGADAQADAYADGGVDAHSYPDAAPDAH
jgi:hypothetical protein